MKTQMESMRRHSYPELISKFGGLISYSRTRTLLVDLHDALHQQSDVHDTASDALHVIQQDEGTAFATTKSHCSRHSTTHDL